jgi:hypothetical protein
LSNRNILQELKVGMLVAVPGKDAIPTIGEVAAIPPNPTVDSQVTLTLWIVDKGQTHKPRWQRTYTRSMKQAANPIADILLYDFTLTKMGMLRKATREYLMNLSV